MTGEVGRDPRGLPPASSFPRLLTVTDATQTRALGAALAHALPAGRALLLHGPLGAGKTCLVQGFCEGLGLADEVISPTFTLVNRYGRPVVINHLDFYRIEPEDDLADIGVEEILDELDQHQAVLLAEWPNLLLPWLPIRVELLGLPGPDPTTRRWYARGEPELPAAVAALFPEKNPSCLS